MFGCHKRDMFTERLPLDEVIALCVANYPGTATHHAINSGWTVTDHLLATHTEYAAGLIGINSRFERPGVKATPVRRRPSHVNAKDNPTISFDSMPLHEFVKKHQNRKD